MLEIVGKSDIQNGDAFSVTCKKCGVETNNLFIDDPATIRFKATCDKCGESREFRLNMPWWHGRFIL